MSDLLIRFFLAGPVLYIGLTMALDPDRFARAAVSLAHVLQDFQHRMNASYRPRPILEVRPSPITRVAGWVLCAMAVLHISGIAT